MTPRKGRPRKGELVDMAIYPPDECSEPSFDDPFDKFQRKFLLLAGQRAGLVTYYRKGTTDVLAFALWQSIHDDGKWREVFRIDSWHGTVHQHHFTKAGNNSTTVLEVIPADHSGTVIETWRNSAEDIIMTVWENNVRRWHGDRE